MTDFEAGLACGFTAAELLARLGENAPKGFMVRLAEMLNEHCKLVIEEFMPLRKALQDDALENKAVAEMIDKALVRVLLRLREIKKPS